MVALTARRLPSRSVHALFDPEPAHAHKKLAYRHRRDRCGWDHLLVLYAGAGRELWRVRVDLFIPARGIPQDRALQAMRSLLAGEPARFDLSCDAGGGIVDRPVIGLLFWVRADQVGDAATTAVETAQRAMEACCGQALELYDVIVIPRDAVILPNHPHYPPMD